MSKTVRKLRPGRVLLDVQVIPNEQQLYPTVGDWEFDDAGALHVRVSDLGDDRYHTLVALHEAIEATICRHRGVEQADITAFDELFEQERALGRHETDDEPGDDPQAPYRREHFFATSIERLIAAELDVDWAVYDDTVMNL